MRMPPWSKWLDPEKGLNEELLPGLRLADSSLACRRPDSSEFGRVWSGLVVCYSVTVFGGVGSSWITSSGFKIWIVKKTLTINRSRTPASLTWRFEA